jgi:hypothetical protein
MGLTAGTDEPIMCIIIFAAAELGTLARLGYDHQSEIPYDKDKTLQENMGPGKALPRAPTCMFRGKEIPALVAMSTKGSMTAEVLAMVLQRLDDLGVYERAEGGPIPFGLFDAHDSRLQLPFLEKANKKMHGRPMWKICIGLPNGTSKWQVGDSKQQNGCWKMSMTREKDKLVAFKRKNGFKNKEFQCLDIVPLIVRAWASSFTRTEKNKHALMERGWYHLNKSLLEDPEILRTQGHDTPSMPSPPPAEDDTPSAPTPIETPTEDDTPSVPTPIETPTEDDTPSVPTPIETPIVDATSPVQTPIETPIVDATPSVPTSIEDNTPPPIETPIEDGTPSVLAPIEHVEVPHMSHVSAISMLDSLNLNFVDGIAGTMTTDLMTFLLRKQKIHMKHNRRGKKKDRGFEHASKRH